MFIPFSLIPFFLLISLKNKFLSNKLLSGFLFCYLFIAISINVVSRDLNYMDTQSYTYDFLAFMGVPFSSAFNHSFNDAAFVGVTWFVGKLTSDPRMFLLVCWAIFSIPFVYCLKHLFKTWQSTLVFFSYANLSFFYDYSMNVLRQGMAISLLMLALTYFIRDEKSIRPYILMVVAPFFHWTGWPFVLIMLLLFKFQIRLRVILGIWIGCAILLLTHLNAMVIGPLWNLIPNINVYSSVEALSNYGNKVNRIDFLLFSLIWILASLALYHYVYRDESYKKIIKTYVLFNSMFLMLGFVAFSDRIAAYSWLLIPILLWYPIFKSQKYNVILAYTVLIISVSAGLIMGLYKNYSIASVFGYN